MSYQALATQLKVLADPSRLEIMDLLSCGELCACDILAHFEFSQPTLSHHMKALVGCGLVTARKDGNKQMYQLNAEQLAYINENLTQLHTANARCICRNMKGGAC
ncbi:ArsR family transcriptional regulator [Staphylococcus microti]|uniref:ArsR family transcriptional regulator n=1 Tax=Staphylococcus microti TaxID=569857 RepID=A0A0D6XM85_9STAP|nr:metalloregulator ArsR/SmtB family transcription factor [Staphylococcus microti]KIX89904.1 ArsR family transcriptional regulator [Staphylococcus microti]PNZ79793.1 ArsR family transcriptional regulator [Staphylococcus microti]SUM58127.1 arsenical resistance operon repressor [Staphylococcus microti]